MFLSLGKNFLNLKRSDIFTPILKFLISPFLHSAERDNHIPNSHFHLLIPQIDLAITCDFPYFMLHSTLLPTIVFCFSRSNLLPSVSFLILFSLISFSPYLHSPPNHVKTQPTPTALTFTTDSLPFP